MKFLLSLDQFGSPIELNLSGKSVHKTIVGTTFTAFFYALISYLFLNELSLLMATSSNITTSTSNLPINKVLQLAPNDNGLTIQVQNLYNQSALDHFNAELIYYKAENLTININLNLTLKDQILTIDLPDSINKSETFNITQNQKFVYLLYYDKIEEKDQDFEDLELQLNWISKRVDEEGVSNSFLKYTSTLPKSGNKLFQFKLHPIKMINKGSYLTNTEGAIKFDFVGEQYYFTPNKRIIAGISINTDDEMTQYFITQPQYFDIVGKIGGFWQFFFLLFNFLVGPINRSLKHFEIMNSLFSFEYMTIMRSASESIHVKHKITEEDYHQQNFGSTPDNKSMRSKLQVPLSPTKLEIFKRNVKNAFSYNTETRTNRRSKTRMAMLKSLQDYYLEKQRLYQLGYNQYLLMKLTCRKDQQRAKSQVEKARIKVSNNLDVTFIIKKLTEIDKLKMLVLSEPQLKLFHYLPKPTIHLNDNLDSEQYWSLLKKNLNDVHRTVEAAKAYRFIQQQCKSSINRRLIEMLDDPMKELFQVVDTQNSEEEAPLIQASRVNLSPVYLRLHIHYIRSTKLHDQDSDVIPEEGFGIQLVASSDNTSKKKASDFTDV